jgi:hypothetical protein
MRIHLAIRGHGARCESKTKNCIRWTVAVPLVTKFPCKSVLVPLGFCWSWARVDDREVQDKLSSAIWQVAKGIPTLLLVKIQINFCNGRPAVVASSLHELSRQILPGSPRESKCQVTLPTHACVPLFVACFDENLWRAIVSANISRLLHFTWRFLQLSSECSLLRTDWGSKHPSQASPLNNFNMDKGFLSFHLSFVCVLPQVPEISFQAAGHQVHLPKVISQQEHIIAWFINIMCQERLLLQGETGPGSEINFFFATNMNQGVSFPSWLLQTEDVDIRYSAASP